MMHDKYQYFGGLKFTRDEKTGYYLNSTIRQRMHRYVWEYYNGPIPAGYHVHHIDEDRGNNDISNLEILSAREHESFHGEERARNPEIHQWMKDNLTVNARPKASEWHRSAAGREWARKNYEKVKDKLHAVSEHTCEYCGKHFESTNPYSRFCSNKCKSAWRRKVGADDETRICKYCGKKFRANKYSDTQCCSRSCGCKLSHATGFCKNKENPVSGAAQRLQYGGRPIP